MLRPTNKASLVPVLPGTGLVQLTNGDKGELIEKLDDGEFYIFRSFTGAVYTIFKQEISK